MEDSSDLSTLTYFLRLRCWVMKLFLLVYLQWKFRRYLCQLITRDKNSTELTKFLSRLDNKVQTEIHYQGNVFFWEYLNHRQFDGMVNIYLKLLTVRKNIQDSIVDVPEVFLDVSEPYVIKEYGWDLIWFSFDGGHMVFYFKKPEGVL